MLDRLYSFLVLFCLVSSSYAQTIIGSELHIKLTEPNTPFLVSIDHRIYYNPDGYFSIGNLNGGNHDFKIYRYIPLTLNRIDSTLLICEGTLFIAPSSRLLIIMDPTKRFFISEFYNPLQYSSNTYLNNSIYTKLFPLVPYNCLDSTSYQELVKQAKEIAFNDIKLTLLKESIFFNGIKTDQLKELMRLFPFDKDRLSLATFAYGSCIDKNKFNTIHDGFAFKQSEQELRNQLLFYYNYGSRIYK
jgi:hypothetical protein